MRKGNLDKVRSRVVGLHLTYRKRPQKSLLIALPNPHPGRNYEIEAVSHEFTSLCPLNPGQPDYATVIIRYTPAESVIELKSLKFYLTSYRMAEIFFEQATNMILDDLVDAIKPGSMEVVAEWNIRGGIKVTVRATYPLKKVA